MQQDSPKLKTDFVVLTLLWAGAVLLANPAGNFPLNDDWSFALTTERLFETGNYHPTGWTTPLLITHVLWGSLFCLTSGVSHEALRFSSIVAGLLGGMLSYYLTWMATKSRLVSFLVALVVLFNPLYFALSSTFMTDVSFTAMLYLAAVFYVMYFNNPKVSTLVLATVFTIVSVLNRQVGLCIPLGFALTYVFHNRPGRQKYWIAFGPLAVSVGAMFLFQEWLLRTGRMPWTYEGRESGLLTAIIHPDFPALFKNFCGIVLYYGWFFSPLAWILAVGTFRAKGGEGGWKAMSPYLWVFLGLLVCLGINKGQLLPYSLNILESHGIGPVVISNPAIPPLPKLVWALFTGIGLLGGSFILVTIAKFLWKLPKLLLARKLGGKEALAWFFLLTGTISIGPFFLIGFFDRYLIVPMAFFGAFLILATDGSARLQATWDKSHWYGAAPALLATALFSILLVQDYFTWNRNRWEMLMDLVNKEKVDPNTVNGGFEFNGYHRYTEEATGIWWSSPSDTYVLSFGAVEGYGSYKTRDVGFLFPPRQVPMYLLKKLEE